MSNLTNVYETPKADLKLEDVTEDGGLALKKTRLFAALIDGTIGLALGVPFMFFIGPYLGYEQFGQQPGLTYLIAATVFGLVAFLLIHGYYLHKSGQTVGKKLLKIKIVSTDNKKVSLIKLFGLRYLPITLSSVVPIIGSFLPTIDALFIFRKDRRCVHDFIAGTKVVNVRNT